MLEHFLIKEHKIMLARYARLLCYGLIGVAFFQIFLTLFFPVNPDSNPVEVYVRNISSIFCFLLLASYFKRWSNVNDTDYCTKKEVKRFKGFIIVFAVFTLAKFIASSYFAVDNIIKNDFDYFYFIGDMIVWGCATVFLVAYFFRLK